MLGRIISLFTIPAMMRNVRLYWFSRLRHLSDKILKDLSLAKIFLTLTRRVASARFHSLEKALSIPFFGFLFGIQDFGYMLARP
jgi:hypothetical protein